MWVKKTCEFESGESVIVRARAVHTSIHHRTCTSSNRKWVLKDYISAQNLQTSVLLMTFCWGMRWNQLELQATLHISMSAQPISLWPTEYLCSKTQKGLKQQSKHCVSSGQKRDKRLPRTGPRPASSIPMRQGSLVAHSGTGAAISTALGQSREKGSGLEVAAAGLGDGAGRKGSRNSLTSPRTGGMSVWRRRRRRASLLTRRLGVEKL
jgi:hypothetical protein